MFYSPEMGRGGGGVVVDHLMYEKDNASGTVL